MHVDFSRPPNLMQDLWLNDNQIPDLEGVITALNSVASNITTFYLNNNPAAAAPGYKDRLMAALPNLQQLDDAYLRGGP